MSTTAIVVIVIAALVIIAIIAWAVTRGRARRLEQKREEATQHRSEAEVKARKAEQARLAAEEHADLARRRQDEAVALRQKADEVDPDIDADRAPSRAADDEAAAAEGDGRIGARDR